MVQFMLEGISKGFCTGFVKPASLMNLVRSNLNGALEHLDVVAEYLHKEMLL